MRGRRHMNKWSERKCGERESEKERRQTDGRTVLGDGIGAKG